MRQWFKTVYIIVLLVFFPAFSVYADGLMPSVNDIASMMKALLNNIPAMVQFVTAFAYIVGVSLIFSAINELRVYGQARTMVALQTNFAGPVSRLISGIALLFFPGIVGVSIHTLWGYGSDTASLLAFDGTGNVAWDVVIKGITAIVQVMGYSAMIRGFMIMSRLGRQGGQPGMFGKALMHIFGGVLAVNIVGTVQVLQATFGFI